MNEEQIRQNALKYANCYFPCNANDLESYAVNGAAYNGYIAGVHSLEDEIEQLRNPWISVDKRLPEEGSDNISIPVAAITNKGYWFKGQYDFNNKDWFFSEDPDHLDFEEDEFVTHWMSIPQIKKGK